MKKMILSALVLFTVQTHAALTCYKVVNPKSIAVVGYSKDGDALKNKIELANRVMLQVDEQDGSGRISELSIEITTSSLKFVSTEIDTVNNPAQHSYADIGGLGQLYVMEPRLSNGRHTLMSDGTIKGWVGSQDTESDMPNAKMSLISTPLLDKVDCPKK